MIITLNNGRSVDITFEKFDAMNDNEWKIFMDSEKGEEINNPFFNSHLDSRNKNTNFQNDEPSEED